MDSPQHMKSRIAGVKNVGQITKAMEVVAATRMRKAQEVALATRPYAFHALELLSRASASAPVQSFLTTPREEGKTMLVVVASDKGLTGSFNAQVFRQSDRFLRDHADASVVLVPIGKKSHKYAAKKKLPVAGNFSGVGDVITPSESRHIADFLIESFRDISWKEVFIISTHFRTALAQEVIVQKILPLDVEAIVETIRAIVPEHGRYAGAERGEFSPHRNGTDYIFEPSPKELIDELLPHLLTMHIHHLILEANASEHSARRFAMKTASDNASDLVQTLTVAYNKIRQAGITRELIEITSTKSALGA